MTRVAIFSDTFSGSTLDAAWTRRGVASETISGGTLTAVLTAGQGYGLNAASATYGLTDYTIEVDITSRTQSVGACMLGPIVVNSAGAGLSHAWYTGSPNGLLALGLSAWTYPGGFTTLIGGTTTYPMKQRMRKSGANWYGSYSTDGGTTWSAEAGPYGGASPVTEIGIYNVAGGTTVTAVINSFEIYADINAVAVAPIFSTCGVKSGKVLLSWIPGDTNAMTWEYRVNGGSWVSVGSARIALVSGLTDGTSYAFEVRGVNLIGNGPPSVVKNLTPSTTATLVVVDDFNRADSTTTLGTPSESGSAWTPVVGTWGINGNQAYQVTSTSSGKAVTAGSYNFDLSFVINVAAASSTGIMFRYTDVNNFWLFYWSTSNGTYRLYRVTGGDFLSLPVGVGGVGDVVRIIARGRYLYFWVNGIFRYAIEDHASPTASQVGLYADATGSRIDNLIMSSDTSALDGGVATMKDPFAEAVPGARAVGGSYLYKGRDTKVADEGNEA